MFVRAFPHGVFTMHTEGRFAEIMVGIMSKADLLVDYIERWLSSSSRRTIQLLTRLSGVPYPTLRRILQRESVPSVENAMAILNLVSTLDETVAYFEENESIKAFYKRVTDKSSLAGQDIMARLIGRESFWIMALGLTIGATKPRVEQLLGAFGLAEFEMMIEEGVLIEKTPGVYRVNINQSVLYVESKRIGSEAAKYIAELPPNDQTIKRYMVYNVNSESYERIKNKILDCYMECDHIARTNEGDVMIAASYVATRVMSRNDEV